MAINGRTQGRDYPDAVFLREVCGLKFSGAGGDRVAITADGKVLATNFQTCVPDALKAWNDLPLEQRKPGAVKLGQQKAGDDGLPKPPPGGLVVKIYFRALGRDAQGRLRHATPQDWLGDSDDPEQQRRELLAGYQKIRPDMDMQELEKRYGNMPHWFRVSKRIYQPHPDFMWLTEAERKSLIAANPQVGDTYPFPEQVAKRIFQFHLDLNRTIGDPIQQKILAGELWLKVVKTSPKQIQLQVEGFAKVRDGVGGDNARKFETRLYGYLDYDKQADAFTRFDMLALGETYGGFEAGLGHFGYSRPGRAPYGVAFELVGDNSPAERHVPPRGAGATFTYEGYFGAVK